MQKLCVLIVEDDDVQSHALDLVLQKKGYEVQIVADGEKAISSMSERVPDLVVLDLVLPKVSGEQVLRTMREDTRLKNVPVIVCTVLFDQDVVERCKELGISGVFKKTHCSLDEIVAAIDNILTKHE